MNTTTTAQGVRCGNHGRGAHVYHANSAEVRFCYQSQTRPVSAPPAAAPSQAPRNADEARSASMQRLANQTSPFFERHASEGRVRLITALVEEHLTQPEDGVLAEAIVKALHEGMSDSFAKKVIEQLLVLKTQRKAAAAKASYASENTAASASAEARKLVARVMGEANEGNFAIEVDGKTRFYRISKRGKNSRTPGSWKIQERVTDMLLPRANAMLGTVCAAILEMGVEASGRLFADRLHQCRTCGASLTDDTGNPYYEMGYGPECGGK